MDVSGDQHETLLKELDADLQQLDTAPNGSDLSEAALREKKASEKNSEEFQAALTQRGFSMEDVKNRIQAAKDRLWIFKYIKSLGNDNKRG